MKRRHERIPSRAMGRPIHVWCYGHWGPALVVFPTAAGMAHEWEVQGMIATLADFINAGQLKVYCTESNVAEAWTRQQNPPDWRIKRHQAFEQYVTEDLVPFIRSDCAAPQLRVAATGASLGGYYAANFALKYPELFHWALCMSGRYDISAFTNGYQNLDVYFNNPLAYVSNLGGEHLERVQKNTHLVLVCGQGPWEEGCIDETNALADLLEHKGISHQRDIWGRDVAHDWGWWKRQARYHLGNTFGR